MSDFFYGEQANLFTSRRFEDVSVEVKVLYGFLLDRMGLSAKNGWKDEEGRVYIIFTVESIMENLKCSNKKAVGLLRELEEKAGLIERRRQGLGRPSLIYVKNFSSRLRKNDSRGEKRTSPGCQTDTAGGVKTTL